MINVRGGREWGPHVAPPRPLQGCSLAYWGSNSQVAHATSATPTGPFVKQDTALPVWSHNPQVMMASGDCLNAYPPGRMHTTGDARARRPAPLCAVAHRRRERRPPRKLHWPRRRRPLAAPAAVAVPARWRRLVAAPVQLAVGPVGARARAAAVVQQPVAVAPQERDVVHRVQLGAGEGGGLCCAPAPRGALAAPPLQAASCDSDRPPPLHWQLYRAPNVTGPYTYLLDIPSGGTPAIFEDGFLFQVSASHATP